MGLAGVSACQLISRIFQRVPSLTASMLLIPADDWLTVRGFGHRVGAPQVGDIAVDFRGVLDLVLVERLIASLRNPVNIIVHGEDRRLHLPVGATVTGMSRTSGISTARRHVRSLFPGPLTASSIALGS